MLKYTKKLHKQIVEDEEAASLAATILMITQAADGLVRIGEYPTLQAAMLDLTGGIEPTNEDMKSLTTFKAFCKKVLEAVEKNSKRKMLH